MVKKTFPILVALFFVSFSLVCAQTDEEIEQLIDKGITYERENKLRQAVEVYRTVLTIDSTILFIKVRLAKVLSWINEYDDALLYLDEVLEVHPEMTEALFRKAQILGWKGEYTESIKFYEAYLEQKPYSPEGLMGIGRIYFWSGENERAVDYFKRAREAGADEVDAGITISKVYLAMDMKEMAVEELTAVLEIDPENIEARRLLRGIPLMSTWEISPLGMIFDIYADKTVGFTLSSYLIYHLEQKWDFSFQYDFVTISGRNDNRLSFSTVYKGVPNSYFLADLTFTPSANFSPYLGTKLKANYALPNGFGAGLGFMVDMYGDAPLSATQNENLYSIKPEVVKYFDDITFVLLGYDYYAYSSGYSTSKVRLMMNLAYYRSNVLSAGFSYGGDVETQDKDKRVFEFSLGISYNITRRIGLTLTYGYIDTQYGKTNQISFRPLLRW